VDQAVLFGAHARGDADEWSDIDLAVVSPDFARMSHPKLMDLLVEVSLAVDPAVEIRPYTPRDLRERRPTNFLGHIVAEGRVVYKDGKFLL
jgi:predicted nucleotidyltransferase